MNGKQKTNQVKQWQQSINGIAKYIDKLEINTKDDVSFYNGMERALSFIENREPVYKELRITKKWKKRVRAHFPFLFSFPLIFRKRVDN